MSGYRLVNPYIQGSINTTFSGGSASSAAEKVWTTLSEHFENTTPRFAFTLQDNKTDKLYHFGVKERLDKDDEVTYSIKELDVNMTDAQRTKVMNSLNNAEQNVLSGGKRSKKTKKTKKTYTRYSDDDDDFDDLLDDSDSDSDYDFYGLSTYMRQPITWFSYYPSYFPVDYLFVPTWSSSCTPYVQLLL